MAWTLDYFSAVAVTTLFHMLCMSIILVPCYMWRQR